MSGKERDIHEKLEALQSRDAMQRATIAAYGVDLAKSRAVDLSFWAPDEHKATLLSGALERDGRGKPIVLPPVQLDDTKTRWIVGVTIDVSVDFITAKENVAALVSLAQQYDCEYDGWGTAIVEAHADAAIAKARPQ